MQSSTPPPLRGPLLRRLAVAFLLAVVCLGIPLRAQGAVKIAFVPLDDRPATELFPKRVAAICGAELELPPQDDLGHFTRPGNTEALGNWLLNLDVRALNALVVSTDMLAYGGLVASRTPAVSLGEARLNLRPLAAFHERHPAVPIYAFGTVMRLAPTATPQTEPYLLALSHYAQLAGGTNLTAEQRAALAVSRSHVPDSVFWDYLGTRARDLDIDEHLLELASAGDLTALALTQDDAGAKEGLQGAEERELHDLARRLDLADAVMLNPGADEMGMVAVARAVEDAVRIWPSLDIRYSTPQAPLLQDRLEYLPVGETIANLARFLRAGPAHQGPAPGTELDVVAPGATDAYYEGLEERLKAGDPIAIADLSFLGGDGAQQRRTVEELGRAGLASKPVVYASWNTTANTAGTALATATCTAIARRLGRDARPAAETFLFERYADDYGYRLIVRPELNEELRTRGLDTYALGAAAHEAESRMRALLWPLGVGLFDSDFAPQGWANSRFTLSLPWQRTFEVQLEADVSRTR